MEQPNGIGIKLRWGFALFYFASCLIPLGQTVRLHRCLSCWRYLFTRRVSVSAFFFFFLGPRCLFKGRTCAAAWCWCCSARVIFGKTAGVTRVHAGPARLTSPLRGSQNHFQPIVAAVFNRTNLKRLFPLQREWFQQSDPPLCVWCVPRLSTVTNKPLSAQSIAKIRE